MFHVKPIAHIDRVWIRRSFLVAVSTVTVFLYLAEGLRRWAGDFMSIWRQP